VRRVRSSPTGPAGQNTDLDAPTPARGDATDGLWDTLSLAGVAAAILAPDTSVVWANASLCEALGRDLTQIVGNPLGLSLGAQPGDRVASAIAATTRHGSALQRLAVPLHLPDGSARTVTISAARTASWGVAEHSVVVVEATTQRRGANPTAASRPERSGDSLTGLPGRATFESLLVSALRHAATARKPFALLIGDLDGFRVLNDTYGPAIGDQVLQWVAERLSATLHHRDTMGRLGGDEFVFIAERVPDAQTARAVGRRLADAINEPIAGSDAEPLSMCIGITLATGQERPVDLLAEADRALQFARSQGPGSIATLSDIAPLDRSVGLHAPVAAS